jgi:hypothetical protein
MLTQTDLNRPQTGDQFKSASIDWRTVGEGMKMYGKGLLSRVPYALGGAAIMAGAHKLNLAKGTAGLEKQLAEAKANDTGTFPAAMQIAQLKARLAFAHAAQQHPTASTVAAAMGGASLGAAVGPSLVAQLRQVPNDIRDLLKKMPKLS